jgi:protein-disulfide isomerase
VEPNLIPEYVETGQVRFEYRDFAFRNEEAKRAAEAAACAVDQGAFWRFHDTLFLNQGAANAFGDPRLKQMAAALGLDTAVFNQCLDSGAKRLEIEQTLEEGRAEGVLSTPWILVNGTTVPWEGWEVLKQAIDGELANAQGG